MIITGTVLRLDAPYRAYTRTRGISMKHLKAQREILFFIAFLTNRCRFSLYSVFFAHNTFGSGEGPSTAILFRHFTLYCVSSMYVDTSYKSAFTLSNQLSFGLFLGLVPSATSFTFVALYDFFSFSLHV